MLKLKLQYLGHLMRRTDSLGKTVMLGKIEGGRRREQQSMERLDSITDSGHVLELTTGDGEAQGGLECCRPWGRRVRDDLEAE